MHSTITRLKALARRLESGDELERWGGGCITDYLEGAQDGLSLGQAFGVSAHGGQAWWHKEARQQQDEALRVFVANHLSGLEDTEQATQLHEKILRYMDTTWRHDRDRGSVPKSHTGTTRDDLFRLFQIAEHRLPLTEKYLLTILRESERPLDFPRSDP